MNDCYNCKYKGNVPGSVHSSCNHPIFKGIELSFVSTLMGNPGLFLTNDEKDLLSFNQYGIKNGWCNFPLDFDPTWVECDLPLKNLKNE